MKRQPTTQQITWFLDLYRNSQLDLEPPYQRKSVWSSKDRKFFLDTIFRNYPAPPIFIHRTVNDQGYTKYHVVDGKQRLETILLFFESKISIAPDFGDVNLNGKKFKDLTPEYKRRFWDYTLVVDFIDSIDGNNIEEVFDRVNRNARNLLPQELRHARYNGWFINFVEEESDTDFWWDYKISTRGRDKRMKNVQFVSELIMIVLENKIVGFDQGYIDEVYAKYDEIEELLESGDFSLEDFTKRLSEIKQFIVDVDMHNESISKFASGSNNNYYTLWAYIHLNNPQNPADFAIAYEAFMEKVSKVKEMQDAGEVIEEDVLNYSNNSKGAVTDLPQRRERLLALTNSI
ncbi:uncharacterized protein DUF262 [Breznakibacter xylanolyticus]|uniref:Uncharacterized protein DUF262 n=1 Tax=Breznakibacter xylanolyticus TaxID=990 RepID=A0A2W7PLT8_9BACT|nr:DUF262 domain-containing protein [Breznakibacter xylanolyticus]PZX10279.1 uncharacterized protein DUF262 [Breznakibacter xylanolyticus]